MRPGANPCVALASVLLVLGCSPRFLDESSRSWTPDRRDYAAFAAAYPDLLEPNYLPFVAHRFHAAGPEGDLLVLCRWSDDDMPLPVYVATPEIPETLQFEFGPRDPASYVRAAEEALAMWERELEGLVTFRRVAEPEDARFALQLIPEVAPEVRDRQIFGSVRLRGACRPTGVDPDAERLELEYEVSALRIFMADEFGLLTSEQVKWIALHEIGHLLGMRSHSPIPADLMFERVRDRVLVPGLSVEDVNTFVSLYQLPNGAIFGRLPAGRKTERGPVLPPTGAPQLAIAPYVDARFGYTLRPPYGWMRVETSRGMVAVDGVTWDYSALFQVVVERYDSLEEYFERYSTFYMGRGRLRMYQSLQVDGHRAVEALIETGGGDRAEHVTVVEVGDGRVIVITAECPAEYAAVYLRWFEATRDSLEIWGFSSPSG